MSNITTEKYIDIGIPSSYWDKEIEVECPKCNSPSLVHNKKDYVTFTCSNCCKTEKIKHKDNSYYPTEWHGKTGVDPFFKYTLFLKEETPYGSLWVYNADQLKHLKYYVGAKIREKKETDKYFSYYISFFHKLPTWIKSSKNRDIILKKISILEKKSITKPNNKTPLDIANDVKESFFYRWNWTNRSWKLLDKSSFLSSDYNISYYPDIKEEIVIIREIKDDKLSIFKVDIKNGGISTEHELIEEFSLENTTKGATFRKTRSGKPTIYYLINLRKLSNESFTSKELLIDVANMNLNEEAVSNKLISFEEEDYMFMFTESKSSHPDFAPTSKDETHTFYGFSESAIKKLLKSTNCKG